MDNALCGGAGATLTGNALNAVKAAIFMGDPHNRAGLPYNVGTCTTQGVSILAQQSIKLKTHTNRSSPVRRPSRWLPVLTRQHKYHQVILRCRGPVLLHRQRRQHPSAVRQQVWLSGSGLHQDKDYRISDTMWVPLKWRTTIFIVYIKN